MTDISRYVVQADAGEIHWLSGLGARIIHRAADGSLAIVEHPIKPRSLASPVHTHANEDEYSFVIEGRVGFQLDGEVTVAGPGAFVVKPRNVPHAFWNAGDEPARVLELISPAGFENFFVEYAAVFPKELPPKPEDIERFQEISAQYGLDSDFASAIRLASEHNLNM